MYYVQSYVQLNPAWKNVKKGRRRVHLVLVKEVLL